MEQMVIACGKCGQNYDLTGYEVETHFQCACGETLYHPQHPSHPSRRGAGLPPLAGGLPPLTGGLPPLSSGGMPSMPGMPFPSPPSQMAPFPPLTSNTPASSAGLGAVAPAEQTTPAQSAGIAIGELGMSEPQATAAQPGFTMEEFLQMQGESDAASEPVSDAALSAVSSSSDAIAGPKPYEAAREASIGGSGPISHDSGSFAQDTDFLGEPGPSTPIPSSSDEPSIKRHASVSSQEQVPAMAVGSSPSLDLGSTMPESMPERDASPIAQRADSGELKATKPLGRGSGHLKVIRSEQGAAVRDAAREARQLSVTAKDEEEREVGSLDEVASAAQSSAEIGPAVASHPPKSRTEEDLFALSREEIPTPEREASSPAIDVSSLRRTVPEKDTGKKPIPAPGSLDFSIEELDAVVDDTDRVNYELALKQRDAQIDQLRKDFRQLETDYKVLQDEMRESLALVQQQWEQIQSERGEAQEEVATLVEETLKLQEGLSQQLERDQALLFEELLRVARDEWESQNEAHKAMLQTKIERMEGRLSRLEAALEVDLPFEDEDEDQS